MALRPYAAAKRTLSATDKLGEVNWGLLLLICLIAIAGIYFFYDSDIPIAVFLGLPLLFNDPSTSPRTESGRIVSLPVFIAHGSVDAFELK